ncbi:MAG TPA: hypothetical protein VGE04_16995 [Chloroflexia bacterium]|jgi:hypothetical protein
MLRYWLDAEREEAITGAWLFDHFVPINEHVEGLAQAVAREVGAVLAGR